MKIYTRRGDDGTTALRAGARVRKDAEVIELNGTVDEAQAALGLARAECEGDEELDTILTGIERDLWILMAEVATPAGRREAAEPGVTAVSPEMVHHLEEIIDDVEGRGAFPKSFTVPGQNRPSAALDFARTVIRRAERLAVGLEPPDSLVVAYLNRLSDCCWALARLVEGSHLLNRRERRPRVESSR